VARVDTLDTAFGLDGLDETLARSQPVIFNTDQGAPFTCTAFTGRLAEAGIRISMDGRGRAHDNIFVERLGRSVKDEEVYPNAYDTLHQADQGLDRYFEFYNHPRPHQALNNRTPAEVYADRSTLSP
jgi:putative transposase